MFLETALVCRRLCVKVMIDVKYLVSGCNGKVHKAHSQTLLIVECLPVRLEFRAVASVVASSFTYSMKFSKGLVRLQEFPLKDRGHQNLLEGKIDCCRRRRDF